MKRLLFGLLALAALAAGAACDNKAETPKNPITPASNLELKGGTGGGLPAPPPPPPLPSRPN